MVAFRSAELMTLNVGSSVRWWVRALDLESGSFRFEAPLYHWLLSDFLFDHQYNGVYEGLYLVFVLKQNSLYVAVAIYFENKQCCTHMWSLNLGYMWNNQ